MEPGLLDEVCAFIGEYPHATWSEVRERFGEPLWVGGRVGSYKVYIEAVYHRRGEFVHVQHHDFGREQALRARRVEPMERVVTKVVYAPCATGTEDEDGWAASSGLVPTVEAFLEALGGRG